MLSDHLGSICDVAKLENCTCTHTLLSKTAIQVDRNTKLSFLCTGKGKAANQILCGNDSVTYAVVISILCGSSLFCSVTLVKASKLTSGLAIPVSARHVHT